MSYYQISSNSLCNLSYARGDLKVCNTGDFSPISDVVDFSDNSYFNEFLDPKSVLATDNFMNQQYYQTHVRPSNSRKETLSGKDSLLFAKNEGWGFWPIQELVINRNHPCLDNDVIEYILNQKLISVYNPMLTFDSEELSQNCSSINYAYYMASEIDEINELYYSGKINLSYYKEEASSLTSTGDGAVAEFQKFLKTDFWNYTNYHGDNQDENLKLTTYNNPYVKYSGIFSISKFKLCRRYFNFGVGNSLSNFIIYYGNQFDFLYEAAFTNEDTNHQLFIITWVSLFYKAAIAFILILMKCGCKIWNKCDGKEEVVDLRKIKNGEKLNLGFEEKLDLWSNFLDFLMNGLSLGYFWVILVNTENQILSINELMSDDEAISNCWRQDILALISIGNKNKLQDIQTNYRLPWISSLVITFAGFIYLCSHILFV